MWIATPSLRRTSTDYSLPVSRRTAKDSVRYLAQTVAPGAHAVLLVDQAGWHLSTRLVVPPNITIIALPPKSPELNPVENVWQFMRDNWLSNRVFKSYDDLVDHCCEAWNKLVDQPWRIMSVGLRQWAHGF
jgi:transposase